MTNGNDVYANERPATPLRFNIIGALLRAIQSRIVQTYVRTHYRHRGTMSYIRHPRSNNRLVDNPAGLFLLQQIGRSRNSPSSAVCLC